MSRFLARLLRGQLVTAGSHMPAIDTAARVAVSLERSTLRSAGAWAAAAVGEVKKDVSAVVSSAQEVYAANKERYDMYVKEDEVAAAAPKAATDALGAAAPAAHSTADKSRGASSSGS